MDSMRSGYSIQRDERTITFLSNLVRKDLCMLLGSRGGCDAAYLCTLLGCMSHPSGLPRPVLGNGVVFRCGRANVDDASRLLVGNGCMCEAHSIIG